MDVVEYASGDGEVQQMPASGVWFNDHTFIRPPMVELDTAFMTPVETY